MPPMTPIAPHVTGPISAAFGASYRDEELWQKTLDPSDEFPAQVNGTLLSDQGVLPAGIRGLIPQGHVSGLGIPWLLHYGPLASVTSTGSFAHLQASLPPLKPLVPGFTPLSTDG